MYKTKIKRYGLFVNIILIAFFAMTAAVTLASAYGAACVCWDPDRYTGMPYALYLEPNLLLFQASNLFTWIVGFVWGGIIYMYLTARRGMYLAAIVTSAVGFIFGALPGYIFDTMNFTKDFTGIGSPHWGRALLNLLVFVVLIVFYLYPGTKKQIKTFMSKENRIAGTVSRQLIMMSVFFFWLAMVSFLGTNMMRSMHVIDGVNVWEFVEFQIMTGYLITAVGTSMLAGGLILHFVRPTPSIITTSE